MYVIIKAYSTIVYVLIDILTVVYVLPVIKLANKTKNLKLLTAEYTVSGENKQPHNKKRCVNKSWANSRLTQVNTGAPSGFVWRGQRKGAPCGVTAQTV